jgi:hypothetical protein
MRKLLAISVALLWSANAQALTGEYGFTGRASCLFTQGEYNAAFEQLATGSVSEFVRSGSYMFNADGTGTLTFYSMNITFSDTAASAGAAQSKEQFHYTVVGDVLTIAGGGTSSGASTVGPRAGQTFTVTNTPTLTGWISRGSEKLHTLTLTTLTPVVETITYSAPPSPYNRICGVTDTLVTLP